MKKILLLSVLLIMMTNVATAETIFLPAENGSFELSEIDVMIDYASDNIRYQLMSDHNIYTDVTKLKTHDFLRSIGIRDEKITRALVESSIKYDIPILTILALIRTESSFRSDAVSSSGAIGFTQIMPNIWNEYFTKKGLDITNKYQNIQAGTYILHKYLTLYCDNDLSCALGGYNVGIGGYLRGENRDKAQYYVYKVNREFHNLLNHK